eukprot:747680-Hanusia_phi.AAC.5
MRISYAEPEVLLSLECSMESEVWLLDLSPRSLTRAPTAWAEVGVDPAEYPRRLGEIIGQQLRQDPDCELKSEKPLVDFLQKAVDELGERNIPGSCTACIAMLTRAGNLHVLNIGDSGLHLIRDGVSIFSTNEQQHYFNCPFQLGTGNYDTPDDADYYILEDLAEGDLIVRAGVGCVVVNLTDHD